MNWKIAVKIWLAGVGIFLLPCLLAIGIGWIAFAYSCLASWLAIPVYAILLWLLKQVRVPYFLSMAIMIIASTILSVITALSFLRWLWRGDDEMVQLTTYDGLMFWGPIVCCCLAVCFSQREIRFYFCPDETISEYSVE